MAEFGEPVSNDAERDNEGDVDIVLRRVGWKHSEWAFQDYAKSSVTVVRKYWGPPKEKRLSVR